MQCGRGCNAGPLGSACVTTVSWVSTSSGARDPSAGRRQSSSQNALRVPRDPTGISSRTLITQADLTYCYVAVYVISLSYLYVVDPHFYLNKTSQYFFRTAALWHLRLEQYNRYFATTDEGGGTSTMEDTCCDQEILSQPDHKHYDEWSEHVPEGTRFLGVLF